ncbi:MAG: DUF2513 domain-containing protein [Methylocystis sp.]
MQSRQAILKKGTKSKIDKQSRPLSAIRITWQGCEFLDAIRDPEIWKKTRSGALAAGGFTFDLLKDLAKGFLKKKLESLTDVTL